MARCAGAGGVAGGELSWCVTPPLLRNISRFGVFIVIVVFILFSPLPNDWIQNCFQQQILAILRCMFVFSVIGKRAPLPLCEGWRRCGKRQIGRLNTKVRKRLNLTWELVGSLIRLERTCNGRVNRPSTPRKNCPHWKNCPHSAFPHKSLTKWNSPKNNTSYPAPTIETYPQR